MRARWARVPDVVRHTFTHFHLELFVLAGAVTKATGGTWVAPENLGEHALPSVMKKVIAHASDGWRARR